MLDVSPLFAGRQTGESHNPAIAFANADGFGADIGRGYNEILTPKLQPLRRIIPIRLSGERDTGQTGCILCFCGAKFDRLHEIAHRAGNRANEFIPAQRAT
jgi:hypothetical protein